jgi:predicted transposase YdaD
VVIYLRRSDSPHVRQNDYQQGKTYHQFEVIRLWEKPYQPLLKAPGLFPFAILAQAEDQENLLWQIAQEIEQISDNREQSNVAVSTAILAGLVLNKEIIQRLLRKDIMKESVIYQDIRDEGLQEGLQRGEAKMVLRQLNRRIGGISPELSAQITSLSLEQLENLGEALLDFQSRQDLEQWLENQAINPR